MGTHTELYAELRQRSGFATAQAASRDHFAEISSRQMADVAPRFDRSDFDPHHASRIDRSIKENAEK